MVFPKLVWLFQCKNNHVKSFFELNFLFGNNRRFTWSYKKSSREIPKGKIFPNYRGAQPGC